MDNTHALARIASELAELVGGSHELLEDALARYRATKVNEHNLKPSTVLEYERALDRIERDLGEVPVSQLRPADVSDHLSGIRPTILPSHYSVLSASFRWLDRRGCPGLASTLPARRPRRRPYTEALTDAEYLALWTGLNTAQRHRWARPVVLDVLRLMMLVPLRRGEAVSLRWPEIDAVGGRIQLHDTKTGDRILPVGPTALSIILRQPKRRDYVFSSVRGGTLHASSIHHAWRRISDRLGVRKLRLHALRHSWASREVALGTPLEHVRRVMGHSTEWMSARYAHLGADVARDAILRTEAFITGRDRAIEPIAIPQLELPFGRGCA